MTTATKQRDGDEAIVGALLLSLEQALAKLLLFGESMNDAGRHLLRAMISERMGDLSEYGTDAVGRGRDLQDEARKKGLVL